MNGPSLPWDKPWETIRFHPGQLTVWAGENGSGKSVLVGQVILNFLEGQKALIASLEMRPIETLYRMACQEYRHQSTGSESRDFCSRYDQRLWIYDQMDSIEWMRILGLIHYASKDLGCDHIVIDSLTKCGLSRDDYAQQAKFIDRLQWAAKSTGIHIHLIAHMRKSQEGEKAGKYGIRGAAEISDLADTVFILRRNYRKEQENAKQDFNIDQQILKQPDAYLVLDKNRHFGELKTWGLNFDPASQLFRDHNNDLRAVA